MLSKKMEIALNKQINAEFWSAYLYLSMSAYFAADGKPGFAHWFKQQFEEEQEHAMKLFDYVIDRDGKVTLDPIQEVQHEWKSPLHAFEQTLAHEKVVTGFVNDLVKLAKNEGTLPNNFEEFLQGRFGNTLYELYFKPYNEKVWRRDLKQVPLSWLEGKLPMPTVAEMIFNNIDRILYNLSTISILLI